jgi:hypothetical protein
VNLTFNSNFKSADMGWSAMLSLGIGSPQRAVSAGEGSSYD